MLVSNCFYVTRQLDDDELAEIDFAAGIVDIDSNEIALLIEIEGERLRKSLLCWRYHARTVR